MTFFQREPTQRFLSRLLLAFVLLYCMGIYSALLVPYVPHPGFLSYFVHALYHTACHQLPDRTFHIGAAPLFVCARCTGIYCGMFLMIVFGLLYRFQRRPNFFILALCFPLIIDVIRLNLHLGGYSLWIACFTGLLTGIAAGELFLTYFYSFTVQKNEQ